MVRHVELSGAERDLKLHGGDVVITVRASDTILRAAAKYKAQEAMSQLKDGGDILAEFGYNPDDFTLLSDRHVMLGFAQLLYAVELAEALILRWEGYVAGGDPLPLSRESIIAVMRQDAAAFVDAEAAETDRVAREGNASTLSRSGTGAGAENIAKGAGPKTPPAPAAEKA